MLSEFLSFLPAYNWQLALIALIVIAIAPPVIAILARKLVPTFKREYERDQRMFKEKQQDPTYTQHQRKHQLKNIPLVLGAFFLTVPFIITVDFQPWWLILLDFLIITLIYDFLFYLVHRFLMHGDSFLKGPLKREHAVHHREINTVANDIVITHWSEVALGQLCFITGVLTVTYFLGPIHLIAIVITWIAHQAVQMHNHSLWEEDNFPFRFMHYLSKMHHIHHNNYDNGNFGTMSPLFDWVFGTLDHGTIKR